MRQHNESSISGKEMEETIKAEIEEIEKYKWYLGEHIGHDPLMDKSLNEICFITCFLIVNMRNLLSNVF